MTAAFGSGLGKIKACLLAGSPMRGDLRRQAPGRRLAFSNAAWAAQAVAA
jgi:hypothetical protein